MGDIQKSVDQLTTIAAALLERVETIEVELGITKGRRSASAAPVIEKALRNPSGGSSGKPDAALTKAASEFGKKS